MKYYGATLVLALTAIQIASASSPKKSLVGTWKEIAGNVGAVVTFSPDGRYRSLSETGKHHAIDKEGTYSLHGEQLRTTLTKYTFLSLGGSSTHSNPHTWVGRVRWLSPSKIELVFPGAKVNPVFELQSRTYR